MPIFGDPQNFLKQASSNNNQMSSLTNDNQQTSMNSSTTQQASNQNSQNQIPDMSGDNSQLQDGMNQDMQTGPGTMQDKTGVNQSTNFETSGKQVFTHAGNEDMTTTTKETVEVEEQSRMGKWIKKKVTVPVNMATGGLMSMPPFIKKSEEEKEKGMVEWFTVTLVEKLTLLEGILGENGFSVGS